MVLLDHVGIPAFRIEDIIEASPGWQSWARWVVVAVTRLGFGPPLFFVMSGYCIAASVDSLRRKGKSPGEFLLKRVWRTYPPYWVALGGFVVVTGGLDLLGLGWLHTGSGYSYSLGSPHELDTAQWWGNLTLTESWRNLVWAHHETNIFTRVAWTLCFQEQFYFLCFLVVLLWPRRLFEALLGVTILSTFCQYALWDVGRSYCTQGLFPQYWHEFAVGVAVFWRLNEARTFRSRRLIELALGAMLAVCAVQGELGSSAVAAAYGLLLILCRPWDARLAEMRWLAPIRACGRRCYSLYLVHMLVCAVAGSLYSGLGPTSFWARTLFLIPLVGGLAIVAGFGFFQVVESRFLKLPGAAGPSRQAGTLTVRPIAATAA